MLIGKLLKKIVTVVSVSCWCVMRIYVFSCVKQGIDSMKNSSNMIYEDNKLLETQKNKC